MKRLKWCCRENAAGALYKIISYETIQKPLCDVVGLYKNANFLD